MNDRRWQRLAAASGIVFVVLWLVGRFMRTVLVGSPDWDAPAQEIITFFADNETALSVGSQLGMLSIFFFLLFLGSLYSALRRGEGDTGWLSALALGSGVATGVLLIAANEFALQATHRAEGGIDTQVLRMLLSLSFHFDIRTGYMPAVLLAATAIVTFQTQALPQWLGWIGAVLAVAFLVTSPMEVPVPIVFFLFLLWVLATSVVLIRRAGPGLAQTQPRD